MKSPIFCLLFTVTVISVAVAALSVDEAVPARDKRTVPLVLGLVAKKFGYNLVDDNNHNNLFGYPDEIVLRRHGAAARKRPVQNVQSVSLSSAFPAVPQQAQPSQPNQPSATRDNSFDYGQNFQPFGLSLPFPINFPQQPTAAPSQQPPVCSPFSFFPPNPSLFFPFPQIPQQPQVPQPPQTPQQPHFPQQPQIPQQPQTPPQPQFPQQPQTPQQPQFPQQPQSPQQPQFPQQPQSPQSPPKPIAPQSPAQVPQTPPPAPPAAMQQLPNPMAPPQLQSAQMPQPPQLPAAPTPSQQQPAVPQVPASNGQSNEIDLTAFQRKAPDQEPNVFSTGEAVNNLDYNVAAQFSPTAGAGDVPQDRFQQSQFQQSQFQQSQFPSQVASFIGRDYSVDTTVPASDSQLRDQQFTSVRDDQTSVLPNESPSVPISDAQFSVQQYKALISGAQFGGPIADVNDLRRRQYEQSSAGQTINAQYGVDTSRNVPEQRPDPVQSFRVNVPDNVAASRGSEYQSFGISYDPNDGQDHSYDNPAQYISIGQGGQAGDFDQNYVQQERVQEGRGGSGARGKILNIEQQFVEISGKRTQQQARGGPATGSFDYRVPYQDHYSSVPTNRGFNSPSPPGHSYNVKIVKAVELPTTLNDIGHYQNQARGDYEDAPAAAYRAPVIGKSYLPPHKQNGNGATDSTSHMMFRTGDEGGSFDYATVHQHHNAVFKYY